MALDDLPIVGSDEEGNPLTWCTTCNGTGVSTYRGASHRTYDEPDYEDTCAICGGSGTLPVSMFSDEPGEDDDDDDYSETSAKEDARNAWEHDGDPDYDTGSLAKEDRRNARYS
jgi:hypothetical protein